MTSPHYSGPDLPPSVRVPPATHPVDLVLSSFGWVVLAGGCGLLALLSPATLLAGLVCSSTSSDAAVCTGAGGTTYVVTVLGGLIVLFLACTISLIGLVVALARGARAWPWVLAGHVVAAVVVFTYVGVTIALTS